MVWVDTDESENVYELQIAEYIPRKALYHGKKRKEGKLSSDKRPILS